MKSFLKSIVVYLITLEARLALFVHKPKIIAVTGSVGKTSTKDAIYSVVSGTFNTRKSDKSQNSEIGVPLTILGLKNAWTSPFGWFVNIFNGLFVALIGPHFPKLLVLEIGADHPHDIENITKWLKPDIAVFTRMSDVPVHVEHFSSPRAVFEEKSFLAKALVSGGTLILNADDSDIMTLKNSAKKCISFGLGATADVRLSKDYFMYGTRLGKTYPRGFEYSIKTSERIITGEIVGALGKQHVYPLLSAVAVGLSLDIPLDIIEMSLRGHQSPKGRMKIVEGVNNSTVIDDTYNSSPVALDEALNTLADLKTEGKKIAVLGDMRELGQFSEKEHEKAGKHASQSSDFLLCVGDSALSFVKGAMESGMNRNCIFTFTSSDEAGDKLRALLATGDVALVKGSQGVRMEKAIVKVLAQPEEAGKLLVRQEEEWKKR